MTEKITRVPSLARVPVVAHHVLGDEVSDCVGEVNRKKSFQIPYEEIALCLAYMLSKSKKPHEYHIYKVGCISTLSKL